MKWLMAVSMIFYLSGCQASQVNTPAKAENSFEQPKFILKYWPATGSVIHLSEYLGSLGSDNGGVGIWLFGEIEINFDAAKTQIPSAKPLVENTWLHINGVEFPQKPVIFSYSNDTHVLVWAPNLEVGDYIVKFVVKNNNKRLKDFTWSFSIVE